MGIDSANVVLWILNNAIMYFNVSLMQRYLDFVEIQNFRRFLSRKQNLHNNIFVMYLQMYIIYQCSTRFPRKMMLVSFKTVAQRVSLVEQELFVLFHFKYFIDKSIGLDNRLCLYKSSPTTRWNHLNTIYIRQSNLPIMYTCNSS